MKLGKLKGENRVYRCQVGKCAHLFLNHKARDLDIHATNSRCGKQDAKVDECKGKLWLVQKDILLKPNMILRYRNNDVTIYHKNNAIRR